jgi:hypothetical protein
MNPTSSLALVLLCAPTGAPQEDALPEPDPAITRAELERHVGYLASDELRGRASGTPEVRAAASYLASMLEAAGLQAGAADGTFLQPIPAVVVDYPSAPRLLFTRNDGEVEEGEHGVDFNVLFRGEARSTEMLPITRISTEVDVPVDGIAERALFFRSNKRNRYDWFAAKGHGDGSGYGLELLLAPSSQPGKPKGAPRRQVLFGPPAEDACEQIIVRGPMRDMLLWMGYRSVQFLCEEEREGVLENNVIAIVPGTDPALKKEIVLFHAAYDHLGVSEEASPDGQDTVRNGANEAAACAALLEVAQAQAARPGARTVAFLFTTATPKTRYGLTHFLEHTPFPLERVVSVLSVERPGQPDRRKSGQGKLWMTANRTSNLAQVFGRRGLAIQPDPYEDAALGRRLASSLFARKGLVAHTLFSTPPTSNEDPYDTGPETLDLGHLVKTTRALEGASKLLATGSVTPTRVAGQARR